MRERLERLLKETVSEEARSKKKEPKTNGKIS
jgi:hypothetical protein